MTPHGLIAALEVVAEAPDGVERLRELVLRLAVRGKLVPQDPADEPVSRLQEQLYAGRERLIADKGISEPRHPAGVPVEDEPYELPSTWNWIRLGDAGAIVGGGTPKSSEPSYWADGNEVPWLTPADMRHQPSRYITRGKRDVTRAGLASSGAQLLPAGSILFSSRAPIGHVGIASSALSTNQGFKSCVPYVAAMSEYLYVFLRKVGPGVDAAATGTTFKEVTAKDVALIPLPLPPVAEQQRIVARVDELMGLLDRLEATRTTRGATRAAVRDSALGALREADTPDEVEVAWDRFAERIDDLLCEPADIAPLRQSVLQLAVRGRLVPQDPADEPASVLLERIAAERARLVRTGMIRKQELLPPVSENEVPCDLPSGWEWSRFGAITDTRLGKMLDKAKNKGPLRPYLRNANVQWFRFVLEDVKELRIEEDQLADCTVSSGDLVICEGGEPGRVAVCGPETDGMVVQKALHRSRPWCGISPWYLAYLIRCEASSGRLSEYFTGATIKHLTGQSLAKVVVPVPPLPEQSRIVARMGLLLGLLDRLEARLTVARTAHVAFAAAAVHHLDART